MRRLTITFLMACLLCAVPVSATTAQSASPTTGAPVLGTGTDALAWLTSMGIAGVEAVPTADGQLRWEATLPMGDAGADVSLEFIGSAEALSSASLTTSTDSDSHVSEVIVMWVQQFHPESLGIIVNALLRGAFVEGMDAEADLPDSTIQVTTDMDPDAPLGEESMSITITIEVRPPA
jgi:hypothetical protein